MTRTILTPLSLLPFVLAAGCAPDPRTPNVELELTATPNAIQASVGDDPTPVTLSVGYGGANTGAEGELVLTFFSSDPGVAVIAGATTSTNPGGCPDKAKCYDRVSSGDTTSLTVACTGVGSATLEIHGQVTVSYDDYEFGVVTDEAKDVEAIAVTCEAETSANDPKLDTLIGVGAQLFGDDGSALLAATNTDLDDAPTPHSSDEVAPVEGRGDYTEWYAHVAAQIVLDTAAANAQLLTCGPQPNGFTFCPGGMGPMPEGPYLVIGGVLHQAPPDFPSDTEVTYGIVMDSDGDPANDFAADPAYPNDFYQGTDRWTELTGTASGWVMTSTMVDGGVPTPITDSQARMVMIDNVLLLIIAASEIPVVTPLHRLTAFEHSGDWGFQSPWAGDLHPQVSEGLASFP